MEDVGLFYGHLVYFVADLFCGHLGHLMVMYLV
jgi:hypothetical protein